MSVGAPTSLKLFISYAHADEAWRSKLAKWLKPLEREAVFQVWHDRQLQPGEDWQQAIDGHLTAADVVLLLVSADFLHSDYAYGREMQQALDQHTAGRTRVVPVILRHCDWNSEGSLLASLQAIPADAQPIDRHPRGEDYAFTEVIRGLRELAKTLRAHRVSASPVHSREVAVTSQPQRILNVPVLTPFLPPAWAREAGRDEYGNYADLEIHGEHGIAVQRFRWIEPGTFWMGSPVEEPHREDHEGPRHRVTLVRGFWLADTACTQMLWVAVMDSNPSRFEGDLQLPVESASWEEVQTFIRRLRARIEGLQASLPTEAQWEYACRAGSQTPFHFGANVTPQHVNYNGNYPYAGGGRGEYRQRTLPVKSLPPNRWGLYQMHGNVWEWCADGPRRYSDRPMEDPEGPSTSPRALRGGSWFVDAACARSACRYYGAPGLRYPFLGFRLCSMSSPAG